MNVDFSRPSPFVFGCQYCKNIISNSSKDNPQNISDQLISIISSTDVKVLLFVLEEIFSQLDKLIQNENSQNSKADFLSEILASLVNRYQDQDCVQFGISIVQFFDKLHEFPERILTFLSDESSLALSIYCCYSNFSQEAADFLAYKLLPRIEQNQDNVFISSEVLYQLLNFDFNNLKNTKKLEDLGNLKNFDINKIADIPSIRECPLSLTPYRGNNYQNQNSSIYDLKLNVLNEPIKLQEKYIIAVPIYSVVMECDNDFLSSKKHVEELFDFYTDFNEKHAAIFVLSLFSPDSNFKDYLDKLDNHQRSNIYSMYREIFLNKKPNFNFSELIENLDVVDFPPISAESCTQLFSCISCFFDKQLMQSSSFTKPWRNKKLQFSILSAMTTISIQNLDFSKNGPLVNLHQLEIPSNIFKLVNNCWVSLEFTERIVSLMNTNKPALELLLGPLINKYPALLLALLGQTNVIITEELVEIIIPPLVKVLQGSPSVLTVLWKLAEPFMMKVIYKLYQKQPSKISIIYKNTYSISIPLTNNFSNNSGNLIVHSNAGNIFNKLLLHEDVGFATDLAFFAISHSPPQDKFDIGNFINCYVQKYTVSSLTKIMDFIRQRMTELQSSSSFQKNELDLLFKYLNTNFDTFPTEIKAFIHRTYMSCKTMIPEIQNFNFSIEISQVKLHEAKQTASLNYSKLLDDEITVQELAETIERYRTTDTLLFRCHVHFLLHEFPFLAKHSNSDIEKLGNLVGHLITSNTLSSQPIINIFEFIKKSFEQPPTSIDFLFAATVLETSLTKLSDFPQFAHDILLHGQQIRSYKSQLFDKVQKICQALNEPIQTGRTAVLNVNPKLKRYEQIPSPPPRVCKSVQSLCAKFMANIDKESSTPDERNENENSDQIYETLENLLKDYPIYREWIANYIVCAIQDTPELLKTLVPTILKLEYNPNTEKANYQFLNFVFQASSAQVYQHIMSTDFDKPEGGFVRRRLLILGKLIGSITLAINRPILSRFLDLKQIILYAFSQGKLYGVVPFVCAIFLRASSCFKIPNPYTSSILQLMASIYSSNNIKLTIKNNIDVLFLHYNVSLSRFAQIPNLFPEKRQNNYDYIMCPFSLQHAVAPPDVERIINFDETAFTQLVSQLIVIPDSPILATKPDLKDKMRRVLLQQSLHLIRSEGIMLSRIASSTAQMLSIKDFVLYKDNDLLMDQAQTLTKQLATGLTLFTIPVKVSRQLLVCLKHESEGVDNEWIESIAQQNYEWIVQLLRDVVRIRSWKTVHKSVENSEEERNQMRKNFKYNSVFASNKSVNSQSYYAQMQQVYNDLGELSLNVQPFPTSETLQTLDRAIPSDPDLDAYLQRITKYNPIGNNSEINIDEINLFIQQCPDLSAKTTDYDKFRPVVKSLIKYSIKFLNTPLEQVMAKVIGKVCQNITRSVLVKAQAYVLPWVKTNLHSFLIVSELLNSGLLTLTQVDSLLTEMLNSEPFNAHHATFGISLLHFLIFKQQPSISPSSVVNILAALSASRNALDQEQKQINNQQATNPIMKQLDELISIYNNMDAPSHQLSAASKLQMVSTFDPIEDMSNSDEIIKKLNAWCNVVDQPKQSDDVLLKTASECAQIGKNFFVYLFFTESERTTLQFLQCADQTGDLKTHWGDMLEAVEMIINGNSHVVGHDMRKFYAVFRALMDPAISDVSLLMNYLVTLHKTRPLLMPSFAFSWIELVTDKHLVYALLENSSNWPSYAILLTDFCALVAKTKPTNLLTAQHSPIASFHSTSNSSSIGSFVNNSGNQSHNGSSISSSPNHTKSKSSDFLEFDNFDQGDQSSGAFIQLYRSFLRFLLILVHDFRDFVVASQPLILAALPFSFHQARNIILSITPSSDVQQIQYSEDIISNSDLLLIKTFVENNKVNQQNSSNLEADKSLLDTLRKNNYTFIRCFVSIVTAQLSSLKQSDSIKETTAYYILNNILDSVAPETALTIVNFLADKLRYECRETSAFVRLFFALFKSKLACSGISEIIARVLFERAATPPPQPFGLISIIKELINDNDRNGSFSELPLSMPNNSVTSFLTAAKMAYLSKK